LPLINGSSKLSTVPTPHGWYLYRIAASSAHISQTASASPSIFGSLVQPHSLLFRSEHSHSDYLPSHPFINQDILQHIFLYITSEHRLFAHTANMPRFTRSQDPERTQLVQAYMILHSQQTSIERRLSASSASSSDSESSSPELSPARLAVYQDSPASVSHIESIGPPRSQQSPLLSHERMFSRFPFDRRTSTPTIPPILESPDEDNEEKLFDVNGRIKMTLTDLLNCPSVKTDDRMRAWVQTRLMDAQQAMNDTRRRRVNSDTTAHAEALAQRLEASPARKNSV